MHALAAALSLSPSHATAPYSTPPHSRWVFEKALEKAGSPCKGTACKSVGLKALQGGCKGRPTDTCSPLYMRPCQDSAMRGGCVASVEQVRASLPSTYSRTRTKLPTHCVL